MVSRSRQRSLPQCGVDGRCHDAVHSLQVDAKGSVVGSNPKMG